MSALKKFFAPALLGTAMAFGAASAHALDQGDCGTIAEMSAKLTQESQNAFGKGRRLSTAKEQTAMRITRPASFGLIYFTNQAKTLGYIVKTDVPLENGPTQMCVDHVIGDIQIADARVSSLSTNFDKSTGLRDSLKILTAEPFNERVIFQASGMKKTSDGFKSDGTIITATANMANANGQNQGRGAILFTNAANGGTSAVYGTADMQYTQYGIKMLGSLLAGDVPRKNMN